MQNRGTFIAFEGGEGSGKDTMIDRLQQKYAGRDDIVFTREPGGTHIGEQIRSLLLSPESKDMSVKTELLLFVAARAQLIAEVIAPALVQDKIVISNRFGLSTVAYQIFGRERRAFLPFLREVSKFVVGEYRPAYILLDVDPEVGLERVKNRADGLTRFDAEKLAFHRRVRIGYMAERHSIKNVHLIQAERPLEVVWGEVETLVETLIK